MMPFILADNFDDSKLPVNLRPYWPLIAKCSSREAFKRGSQYFGFDRSEINKICYLTIQESFVEEGLSQRRPGLHVDCPGNVKLKTDGGGEIQQVQFLLFKCVLVHIYKRSCRSVGRLVE